MSTNITPVDSIEEPGDRYVDDNVDEILIILTIVNKKLKLSTIII